MTSTIQTAQLIRSAAEYMREHGHCKGTAIDAEGRVCLVGALTRVTNEVNGSYSYAADELCLVVGEQYPDRVPEPGCKHIKFNNHPDTTMDEVLAVMEKAAIRLEERVSA